MRAILAILLVAAVRTDQVLIKSGASNEEAGQHENADIYTGSSAKGIANYEGEAGFNHDNENKHVQAQDEGKYSQDIGEKKLHSSESAFKGDNFHEASGGDLTDVSKKGANKKGHHKSGYTKSFHKDESASSSSFYDDADHEGSEFAQNSRKNMYGDAGQQAQKGSSLDDRRYANTQDKSGFYNNAGLYDNNRANRRDYNNKNYYDNSENSGRRNAAKAYGGLDNYHSEHYQDPYYQDSYYHRPQRKITIYEDPRYEDSYQYPRDDYIQLELKRPPRDYNSRSYYYDRPRYDDYYYY